MNTDKMTISKEQLEQMSTERLDEMLNAELKADSPDGDLVRDILSVLEERESGQATEISAELQDAWNNYLKSKNPRRHGFMQSSWFLRTVAAIAVICILVSVVPRAVEAEGLFERFTKWNDSFFQLLRSGDQEEQPQEYVFRTDNPGLQQVYNAVTELGITEPVVPMWIPENGELATIRTVSTRDVSYVVATLSLPTNGAEFALLQIKKYLQNAPCEYPKDAVDAEIYEIEGIEYNIILNDGKWLVVCAKDNLEFCLYIECQKDDLYRLIDSIYMMEAY